MLKVFFSILPTIAVPVILAGCASLPGVSGDTEGGYIVKKEKKNGTKQFTKVQQPENPEGSAVIEDGTYISTGSSRGVDIAVRVESKTTWAGILLILAGLAVMGFSGYIPILNAVNGLYVAGAGGIVLFLPMIGEYLVWVFIATVLAASGWFLFKEYRHSLEKERREVAERRAELNGNENSPKQS